MHTRPSFIPIGKLWSDCYTQGMSGRTVLLYDERVHPSCWNERMTAGEYAVHYSSFENGSGAALFCTVFSSLEESEAHARQETERRSELHCRIYDHEGLGRPPVRELSGSGYKEEDGVGPRFRRWGGAVLFFGGLILTIIDWRSDFELSWPAMIGIRLLAPGLVLLVADAVIVFSARRRRSRDNQKRAG
ncbi:MAG: hypothetical protein WBX22_21255 [Silvibacterium sp.]